VTASGASPRHHAPAGEGEALGTEEARVLGAIALAGGTLKMSKVGVREDVVDGLFKRKILALATPSDPEDPTVRMTTAAYAALDAWQAGRREGSPGGRVPAVALAATAGAAGSGATLGGALAKPCEEVVVSYSGRRCGKATVLRRSRRPRCERHGGQPA
jgi:hypothetical protein